MCASRLQNALRNLRITKSKCALYGANMHISTAKCVLYGVNLRRPCVGLPRNRQLAAVNSAPSIHRSLGHECQVEGRRFRFQFPSLPLHVLTTDQLQIPKLTQALMPVHKALSVQVPNNHIVTENLCSTITTTQNPCIQLLGTWSLRET